MLITIVLLVITTLGGLGLTYLIDRDARLLWRLSAGLVIGTAVFGTILLILACLAGMNAVTVVLAAAITALPAIMLTRCQRDAFTRDRARAKGRLQGANTTRILGFVYYAGFFILFCLFFGQAMYTTDQGIFTGGSNNLGDLPYHLGAIFSFTDGANFPPQNPSFAGAKFTYPFISDLATAAAVKLGSGVSQAMLVQNVAWAFALLVILERFVFKLTADRVAARVAPPLLFLCGGLGFLWFFADLGGQSKGLFELLAALPKDYTIGEDFRWGNSLTTLFLTQRSLLLGMPITIVVLGGLWDLFSDDSPGEMARSLRPRLPAFLLGMIAGLLPLVHLHSLAVLFVVTAVLFALRPARWADWLAFGAGVCVIAIPALIWLLTGSATETTNFFGWHFGWDSRGANIVWFWLKNLGLFIPLIAAGGVIAYLLGGKTTSHPGDGSPRYHRLLLFYIPFALLFVIGNVAKLAPWEWDNIKVLIYWFVGSLPLVGLVIAALWHHSRELRFFAILLVLFLVAAGSLDVIRTISGAVKMRVFEPDGIKLAERVKSITPPNAMILNAPTYNSPVVLSGRRSLMRYPGHLASHGIDYGPRENDVKMIYAGGPQADELLSKYGIDLVLISPEERNTLRANEDFFKKFPVAAQFGQYSLYKVR